MKRLCDVLTDPDVPPQVRVDLEVAQFIRQACHKKSAEHRRKGEYPFHQVNNGGFRGGRSRIPSGPDSSLDAAHGVHCLTPDSTRTKTAAVSSVYTFLHAGEFPSTTESGSWASSKQERTPYLSNTLNAPGLSWVSVMKSDST